MDRKTFYDKLSEISLNPPTDRNDILAKRFGAPMKKMTYREACIDYVKKTMRCLGFRNYVVYELEKLEKLEKIEQIVNDWSNGNIEGNDTILAFHMIKEVLEQE